MAILYSTGPLENAFPEPTVRVALKALNNSFDDQAAVQWTVYRLDGHKVVQGSAGVGVGPQSSAFVFLSVSAPEFEVQALVTGEGADDVLVSVFGEDNSGEPVDVHRLVYSEMTRIRRREESARDGDTAEGS